MRAPRFGFLFAVAAGLAGCTTSELNHRTATNAIPVLDVASPSAAGLSAAEIGAASRLYVSKCVRCHKSYNPTLYADAEWASWMRKMSKKARLKPDQEELLARYLAAIRAAGSK